MIKIESLSKLFNEKKVVENLTLEVKRKEVMSLLGPNGSGKTTLLNMIAGLLHPDSGNIYINNTMVYGTNGTKKVNLKPSERKIGYVFQTISLFPHMKIQDNIAYGLKSLHISQSEIKKRTNTLLDFVDLTEYALLYPNQLSGGQQQRAALARSLATEPQVILLDEPVSAVDPQLRETFRLDLKKYLQKLETTTLYVTHNLNEAFMMADKIAVMGNRHIEQVGDRTEIFDKTQSTFVAKFLGLNIFKGKAIKEQNGHLLIDINNNISVLSTSNPELIGKNVTITIKPEDITFSKTQTTNQNATNNILGVITEMVQTRSTTQVTIDLGFPVKTRTTSTEIKNLGVTVGDKIYVTFNFSEVNVFSEKEST
ncbi:MAG: ABC transporter ATP-binding protein [Nitrososphaerota archaeon]|jgi:ABC-type Fe3+/spermidine/putrescine transport system ATPase subunit|nr:ABC transporter ATP-binding protein [Nitrososphaerota archaeon]